MSLPEEMMEEICLKIRRLDDMRSFLNSHPDYFKGRCGDIYVNRIVKELRFDLLAKLNQPQFWSSLWDNVFTNEIFWHYEEELGQVLINWYNFNPEACMQ